MTTHVRNLTWALLALAAAAGCTCDPGVKKTSGIFKQTPSSLDWATGCLHDTNERVVLLQNQGNADLDITDIHLEGDDAYQFLEDKPTSIPAQGEVPVKIGFTPQSAEEFNGTLVVTTDAEDKPTQRTSLIGRGFAGNRYELHATCFCNGGTCGLDAGSARDCNFLSFDQVPAGTTLDRKVRLENRGCAAVDVNEAAFVADAANGGTADDVKLFSFVGDSTGSVRGGETKDVVVRFSAPLAAATPAVQLHFASTDPQNPTFDLGLFANSIAPALVVDKDVLTFFEAQTGVPLGKTFTISNQGDAPLTVDSVTLVAEDGTKDFALQNATGSFTLAPSGSAGSTRDVTAVYTSSGPGSDKAKAVVKAGAETREVRLLGGTEPQIDVVWLTPPDTTNESAPPVDFGNVDTGAKGVTRTLRIKNIGQAPLTVSGLAITDNPANSYVLGQGGTGQYAAGTSKDVTITFNDAVTLRDDAAKVKITSDDPIDAANGGARSVDLKSTNEPNFRPVITIDVSSAPAACQELKLDASRTTGPEAGDTLTFQWTMPKKPAGSSARLESPTQAITRVVSGSCAGPDTLGTYVFKLTVTDQFGNVNDLSQTVVVR